MATRWNFAWSMWMKKCPCLRQYKIVLIPTQVFFDASGKEVDRHIGALTKEEVIKKLKELKFIR